MIRSSCHDGVMMRTEICWLMRSHQVLGGYGGLHAVVLAGHSSAPRWGKAAELHFGFWISLGWSGDGFRMATSASWLPAHHVPGDQCKLAARSSCFWLPVQADCQIIMFLATSASWLPGHDVSGYQCKLAARSSCFWLSVQAGCQIIIFLATSANFPEKVVAGWLGCFGWFLAALLPRWPKLGRKQIKALEIGEEFAAACGGTLRADVKQGICMVWCWVHVPWLRSKRNSERHQEAFENHDRLSGSKLLLPVSCLIALIFISVSRQWCRGAHLGIEDAHGSGRQS